MLWQANEGLGAVNYNMGELRRAQKHFISALKHVENNPTAQDRIETKLRQVIQAEDMGVNHRPPQFSPYPGSARPGSMQGYSTGAVVQRQMGPYPGYMQTHGPLEDHAQMGNTPVSLTLSFHVPICVNCGNTTNQLLPLFSRKMAYFF